MRVKPFFLLGVVRGELLFFLRSCVCRRNRVMWKEMLTRLLADMVLGFLLFGLVGVIWKSLTKMKGGR